MGIDRREFIKGLGGACAALGFGGVAASGRIFSGDALASQEVITPSSGVRLGMVVDVMRFTSDDDYQRCIDACDNAHNIPHFDRIKDEIKWIWTEKFGNAFPSKSHQFLSMDIAEKTFPVLCNHCQNPSCVRVCPTKATFKDTSNGITMMDYHRCIGCRFCMAACPYGARSFNWLDPRLALEREGRELNKEYPTRERGVVEKCNFCAERLAKDKRPACVEESRGALVFGDLNDANSDVRRILRYRRTIQRKPELGTNPSIFYIV